LTIHFGLDVEDLLTAAFQGFLFLLHVILQIVDLGSESLFHLLSSKLFATGGGKLGFLRSDLGPEALDDLLGMLALARDHGFTFFNSGAQSAESVRDNLLELLHFLVQTRSITTFYPCKRHRIGLAPR